MASLATYERLSLEEPAQKWEFVGGHLRAKPAGTMLYNRCCFELASAIRSQISHGDFDVRCDQGRLRVGRDYLVPSSFVIHAGDTVQFEGLDDTLEAYTEPMPFVAEVWPSSTWDYDVTAKLAAYQARGDAEIWLVHPYEQWVRAFVRRSDGSYEERRHTSGWVELSSVPGVRIDVERLFARR